MNTKTSKKKQKKKQDLIRPLDSPKSYWACRYAGKKEGLKVALWHKKAQQPKVIIYRIKQSVILISMTH